MPTRSLVVASVTSPILLVDQPPALAMSRLAIPPHWMFPDESVFKALLPLQVRMLESVRVLVKLPEPDTSSARVGAVPMPRNPFSVTSPSLAIEITDVPVRSVDEAMLKVLSEALYPMIHALLSSANCKTESPVPAELPRVARPLLLTEKSVTSVVAVEELMAKTVPSPE